MSRVVFYPGLHQPSDARHVERACISVHRLETRRKPVECADVLVDSGAFTKLAKHGLYPKPVEAYAAQLYRLWSWGVVRITCAVAQDYMCEPFMLAKTGLTVAEHQRLTVERYDALTAELRRLFEGPPPFAIMPVLQGWTVRDYLAHLALYGGRLTLGMWVGVGSVCKRQGSVALVEDILHAIKEVRPDLRLHGFRREADGAPEPAGAVAALQRGQHGVELQRPEAGAERQRLAGGGGVRGKGEPSAPRADPTPLALIRSHVAGELYARAARVSNRKAARRLQVHARQIESAL